MDEVLPGFDVLLGMDAINKLGRVRIMNGRASFGVDSYSSCGNLSMTHGASPKDGLQSTKSCAVEALTEGVLCVEERDFSSSFRWGKMDSFLEVVRWLAK